MRNQRILNTDQVSWYDEGSKRLSYQMIFSEPEVLTKEVEETEEEVDLGEILEQRDLVWKSKLKREKEEAYTRGLEQGRAEGLEQAREEIDSKLSRIQETLQAAHNEWIERQKELQPGILDMVFDITERILTIPVENPEIRASLDTKLGALLQKVDESSRPTLFICEDDFSYVEKLAKEFAPNTSINIKVGEDCNPGEFRLESNHETVVHNFRESLKDFMNSLALPSWK